MGLARLLLAICVLDFHSVASGNPSIWPIYLVNGVVAVQSFYVISGFYMSLVLTGRYADRSLWTFYRARLLRLLPMYWIVAGGALAYAIVVRPLIIDDFFHSAHAQPLLGVWVLFSNLTLIGQDWNYFIPLSGEADRFMSRFNILHVAWTLGVEVTFYAMAPALVLLRSRWIILLLLCSVGLRMIGARHGLTGEPWGLRFFPFELAWFLMGIIAHRVYMIATERMPAEALRIAGVAAFVFLLLSIGWYSGLYFNRLMHPVFPGAGAALPYATALALPFVFALTRDSKVDAFVGEFSYPVYLVHAVVMAWLAFGAPAYNNGWVILILSLLISAILLVALRPIERDRHPAPTAIAV